MWPCDRVQRRLPRHSPARIGGLEEQSPQTEQEVELLTQTTGAIDTGL